MSAKVWDVFLFLCPKSSTFWGQPFYADHLLGDLQGAEPEHGVTGETGKRCGGVTPESPSQERSSSSKLPGAKVMCP